MKYAALDSHYLLFIKQQLMSEIAQDPSLAEQFPKLFQKMQKHCYSDYSFIVPTPSHWINEFNNLYSKDERSSYPLQSQINNIHKFCQIMKLREEIASSVDESRKYICPIVLIYEFSII